MYRPLETITCSLVHAHAKCHTARRLPTRDVCAQAFPDFSMFNQRVMKRLSGTEARPRVHEERYAVTYHPICNLFIELQCFPPSSPKGAGSVFRQRTHLSWTGSLLLYRATKCEAASARPPYILKSKKKQTRCHSFILYTMTKFMYPNHMTIIKLHVHFIMKKRSNWA